MTEEMLPGLGETSPFANGRLTPSHGSLKNRCK